VARLKLNLSPFQFPLSVKRADARPSGRRGVHPEGIHPEGDTGGEVDFLNLTYVRFWLALLWNLEVRTPVLLKRYSGFSVLPGEVCVYNKILVVLFNLLLGRKE
jgi:hypothetical protein